MYAALDEVCRVEYACEPALKMLVKVEATLGGIAVDALFVFMAAKHVVRKRIIRHPAHAGEHLIPISLIALAFVKVKAEHADQVAAEDFCDLDRVLEGCKMRLEIIRDIHFAIGRTDCGNLHALGIELCLEHPRVVCRKRGDIALGQAAELHVRDAVCLACADLFVQIDARLVGKGGKDKFCHRFISSCWVCNPESMLHAVM